MVKHYAISIHGTVSGVGFRSSTAEKAKELRLFGFVRNQVDRSVYIEVQGEEENLKAFLAWCKSGPRYSKVKSVQCVVSDDLRHFRQFAIL